MAAARNIGGENQPTSGPGGKAAVPARCRRHPRLAWALLGGLLAFAPGASADTEAGLRARLAECRSIASVLPRLDCYDRLALAEASAPPRRSHANPSAPSAIDRFGRDAAPSAPSDPPIASVSSSVASLEQRPRGEYVFRLANGQTWTELSPGRGRYEQGATVEIRRTRLGAFMLTAEGSRATRVRRID